MVTQVVSAVAPAVYKQAFPEVAFVQAMVMAAVPPPPMVRAEQLVWAVTAA